VGLVALVGIVALLGGCAPETPGLPDRDEFEALDAGPRLDAGRDAFVPSDTGPRPDSRACIDEDRCGNGIDDDCDGTVDEGCELPVTLSDRVDGTTFGGAGGTGFSRICYPGQVARGLHGAAGLYVDRIGLLCASITVAVADEPGGRVYKLAIDPTVRGVVVGGDGGAPFELGCPDDQILGGIFGAAADTVRRVGAQCVRPVVTDAGDGELRITFEDGERLGPEGGTGGTSFRYDCAPSRSSIGIRGRSGRYLDAFGISCQRAGATDPAP
jgi:hypothetical protein